MPDIRILVAVRQKHRYANTYPWRKLNSFLTGIFNTVDYFIAMAGLVFCQSQARSLSGHRTLHFFKRIVHRLVADLESHDGSVRSHDPRKTLLRLSSVGALRKLYPYAENIFGLKYLDFLYLQFADCQQGLFGDRPIVDVAWNQPELFEEVCCLQKSCVILILHNGFAHGIRALSYFKKNLVAVFYFPEYSADFYKANKVNRPNDIEIIPVDREVLLKFTKVAKNNKAMICAPDAGDQDTGHYDLLSLGMFQLARSVNVPLYFFDFCMDDDCILRGFIKGPVDYSAGAFEAAEDFRRFCQSISGRTLTIMDKGWESRLRRPVSDARLGHAAASNRGT
jgi:hypothetical protein